MAYLIVKSGYLIVSRLLKFLFVIFCIGLFCHMPRAFAGSPEDKIDSLIDQIVSTEAAPTAMSAAHIDIKNARDSYERCKERWQTSRDQLLETESVSLQTMQRIRYNQDFLECMTRVIDVKAAQIFSEDDKEAFLLAIHSQQLKTHSDECTHDDGLLTREQEISQHIGYVQLIVETLLIEKPTRPPSMK